MKTKVNDIFNLFQSQKNIHKLRTDPVDSLASIFFAVSKISENAVLHIASVSGLNQSNYMTIPESKNRKMKYSSFPKCVY